jgi:hypothetical protein
MYVVSSFLANPSGAGVAPYPSTYASYVRRAHHAPPAHATTPLLHRRNRSAPPIVLSVLFAARPRPDPPPRAPRRPLCDISPNPQTMDVQTPSARCAGLAGACDGRQGECMLLCIYVVAEGRLG